MEPRWVIVNHGLDEKQYAGTWTRCDLWWICYKTLEPSSLNAACRLGQAKAITINNTGP